MDIELLKKLEADVWVFDNDGTLYGMQKDLQAATVTLMIEFIARERGIPFEEAAVVRGALLRKHHVQSTVIALQREKGDVPRFIRETYLAVPLGDFGIAKCPHIFEWIDGLRGRKLIMTNSPADFAGKILAMLGCATRFDGIVGIEELGFNEKPSLDAFRELEKFISGAKRIVFVDDKSMNVMAARARGYEGIVWKCPCQKAGAL